MSETYYAVMTDGGDLLQFNYDSKYEDTYVEICNNSIFEISKALFIKREHAEYELTQILSDPSYDTSEIENINFERLEIVKVEVNFGFKIKWII